MIWHFIESKHKRKPKEKIQKRIFTVFFEQTQLSKHAWKLDLTSCKNTDRSKLKIRKLQLERRTKLWLCLVKISANFLGRNIPKSQTLKEACAAFQAQGEKKIIEHL